jgi:hypothetical protein
MPAPSTSVKLLEFVPITELESIVDPYTKSLPLLKMPPPLVALFPSILE